LFAAFFSMGYGMHDDHFGPIEQPFQIMNDYSVWQDRGEAHGHSIAYPALHYYLFQVLEKVSITDPQSKMLIVRILHAFYSLLIVFIGYKIARLLTSAQNSRIIGLMLALFWIFPFMSVRNLIEFVCIPPLLAGTYFSMKDEKKQSYILAGLMFAISFVFRVQTLLFPFGIGIILLFKKKYSLLFTLSVSLLVSAFLTQGIIDWLAWGYPFAAFWSYFSYNVSHSGDYTSGPFYNYLLLIFGALIPPASLFFFKDYFAKWKKNLFVFLPSFLYLFFHSVFPNKQERFILPFIPFFIILGAINYSDYLKKKILKYTWTWFWIANSILLVIFTFTYSKKSRVESFYYLSKKDDVKSVLVDCGKIGSMFNPTFYMNKYSVPVYTTWDSNPLDSIASNIKIEPNYIIMYGDSEQNERVEQIEQRFQGKLEFETEISSSFVDQIFYYLNPKHNKNETAFIYKLRK
ncbi:MAG: hypothetical protein GX121_07170, partial [Ignavibacteria bacterium]|nr:hypothetical protein [Ignavibacteria bacterium]